MSRFVVLIVAAFAASFVGASWAMSGFPFPAFDFALLPSRPADRELRPSPDMPTFRRLTDTEIADHAYLDRLIKEKLESVKSEDPAHDFQRNNVIREAAKYVFSPCTEYTKLAVINAITEYVQSYRTMRGCNNIYMCSPGKMDLAWKAFSSDLDQMVRSVIREAYERGGFSAADFPASMADDLGAIANLREKTPKVCGPTPRVPYPPRTR